MVEDRVTDPRRVAQLLASELSGRETGWLARVQWPWIPAWGISFHGAADGLSLILVVLTFFLGLMAVGISWREID